MKRILLLSLLLLPIVALAQYPTFSNKQKLGVQTTGDGLIFRGNSNPSYNPSNINNAYFYLDTTTSKLYLYSVGTWQQVYPTTQFDTTTLNVYLKISDTTAMLLPYFRDSDTTSLNLISRFALKLNISDTVTMLTPYLRKADTISLSNRINLKLNISDTTILSNRITTNANNIIIINNKLNTKLDTIYKKLKNVVTRVLNKDTLDLGGSLTEGFGINIIGDSINIDTTIIFTQSDTITLSNRIDTKLNVSDTVSLSNRIDLKLNKTDTINLSNRIDLKLNKSDTISLSNRIDIKLNASDTVSLSNRINKKLDTLYVNYQTSIDTIVNKDTINITTLEAGTGINITNNVISLDTTLLDSVVRVQNVYVKNGTGTVLNKGEAVYVTGANGTNIIVGRASNVAESTSSKTLGLTMTSIAIDGFGYVVKEGLLAGLNTSASDSAGVPIWLGVNGALIYGLTNKPYAPNHLVYLGIVTRKQQNNGEVYVTVQNGFEIKELHDVQIINPVNKASLYYNLSESLWRDTTDALLVSDTASMLNPYLKKLDTISLSNRIDLRVKYADTTNMLLPYFRTNDTTLLNLNSRLSIKLNLSDTASMLSKYVNTYSNQTGINGDKTFNNVITIDSATVTGKLLVNTNISDAVKINSNTNSTNLELMNSGGSVYIKSSNKNMTLQTDTTALVYLKGDVNRVGILTMNPQQALEVAGTIRVDSLGNNLIPTKLVGGSNSNDLTDVKLGTGLSFINDTLKIADNIINSGDTATLLRYDYYSITTNKLVWTEGNKKLIPYFTQVYRNGQLLKLIDQYLFSGINNDTITLQAGNYKLGDNITVIAIDNIVALAGSGGVISLQGNVSGSGTNPINTTINNGVVTNSMLAGSISNDKLDVITATNKVSNSATTATNNNTVNTIVSRDGSGNFSAGIITASLNGNANTSTTLATGRTIGITGDLTYTSPSFNGSVNVTAVGTLANSGVTANTYTAATVTVDAKGRVTSASSNTIPTVNDGTLTMAVSGNGLTGSQTFTANQSSAATFTVTSNATSSNTPSTIVYRDANRDFIARNITASNFYGFATSAGFANNLLSVTGGPSALVNFSINTASLNGVRTVTIPDNNVTMATTNLSQTFGGTQTFSNTISGSITGNASTATNVAYSGLTGTVPTWNQNTTGTAATITGVYSGTITSSQITTGLGFTPYNATNPNSYITSSALSPYATLASPTFTGTVVLPSTTSIGNVTNTEIGYVDGVTSSIQTQLNAKQNTLSNASTTVNGILTAANFNIFNDKQSSLNGTGFVKASGTSISYDNTSYLPLTGGTLSGSLSVLDSISIGSLSQYTGRFTRYLKTSNVSPYIDLNIGSVGTIGTWRGRINFQTSYNTENPTTAMTINEFGNINMNGTLSVTGSTTINNVLTINSGASNGLLLNGTNSQFIKVYSSGTSFANAGTWYQNTTTGQTEGSDGLFVGIVGGTGSYFTNYENSKTYFRTSSNTNQLVLDTNGNVGVGIEDATNKLDVNGTLRVRTTNTVTPTSILGKDNNGVVGGIVVGNGLSFSINVLNVSSKITDINTSQYSIISTDLYIDNFNNSSTTIILPLAGLNVYRELKFKNSSNGALIANGNIVPLSGSGTTTTILPATNAKWCTLVSDGSFWRIMQSN